MSDHEGPGDPRASRESAAGGLPRRYTTRGGPRPFQRHDQQRTLAAARFRCDDDDPTPDQQFGIADAVCCPGRGRLGRAFGLWRLSVRVRRDDRIRPTVPQSMAGIDYARLCRNIRRHLGSPAAPPLRLSSRDWSGILVAPILQGGLATYGPLFYSGGDRVAALG